MKARNGSQEGAQPGPDGGNLSGILPQPRGPFTELMTQETPTRAQFLPNLQPEITRKDTNPVQVPPPGSAACRSAKDNAVTDILFIAEGGPTNNSFAEFKERIIYSNALTGRDVRALVYRSADVPQRQSFDSFLKCGAHKFQNEP